MNREQQLEAALREAAQLAGNLLLQLSARGMLDAEVLRYGAVIDRLVAVADPPPANVIPFPVKRAN